MYAEHPPPASLSRYVECLWRHELTADDDPGIVLPDGRTDLVWSTVAPVLVAGPQTRFTIQPLAPPVRVAGVRFWPGAGPALLGVDASAITDAHVPVDALDTPAARWLARRLAGLTSPTQALSAMTAALRSLVDDGPGADPLVRAATQLLDHPGAQVGALPGDLALSERQLQRRFLLTVGYGPKTLQRVLRFQRLVAVLCADREGGLAGAAARAGYADQAHMTRETGRLAGMSPARLAERWRA